MHLVLASASPRRAALLEAAGFTFDVAPAHVDESAHAGEAPEQYVARLAKAKAVAVASEAGDAIVLGADTIVVVGERMLGKPGDWAEAAGMLRLLAGRVHEVLTGVCLVSGPRSVQHVETTRVRMTEMTDAEIAWYVGTREPMDKAGAYAAQGVAARFVESIDGSYSNVVGLPIARVYGLLKLLGCDILAI